MLLKLLPNISNGIYISATMTIFHQQNGWNKATCDNLS